MDLLNALLVADCRISPAACLDGVDGGGGFAASVRDLRVTLMTCVARTVLSRELNVSAGQLAAAFAPVPRFAALVLGFVVDAVVFVARAVGFGFGTGVSVSGRRSSLSATTVAGVHVEVDETAALTASIFACNEAM